MVEQGLLPKNLLSLHPKQWEFLSAILTTSYGVLLPGAYGSGKSLGAMYGFMLWSQARKPNGYFLIASRTSKQAMDTLFPIIRMFAEDFGTYAYIVSDEGSRVAHVGDARYLIRGANDDSAASRIQGSNYDGAFFDELVLLPESFFDMGISRVRVPGQRRIIATCNPGSPRHWVKVRLIDKKRDNWLVIPSLPGDNPSLPPEYEDTLREMYTGPQLRRGLYGEWAAATGAVYPEFEPVVVPDDKWVDYFVSIDHGYSTNTHALLFVQRKGEPDTWYVVDEWVSRRGQLDQNMVDELMAYWPGVTQWVVDMQALGFRQQAAAQGISLLDTNKDVAEGISIVSAQLANGMLQIDQCCDQLIGEMYNYIWDERATEHKGLDIPLKNDDHGPDALRYGVMSRTGSLTGMHFKIGYYDA